MNLTAVGQSGPLAKFITEDIYVNASDLEEAKRLYDEAVALLETQDFEYDFEETESESEEE